MSGGDELDRLAAIGRETAAQKEDAAARRAHEEAQERDGERRDEMEVRMLRAASRWGVVATTPWAAWLFATFAGAGLCAIGALLLPDAWLAAGIGAIVVVVSAAGVTVRGVADGRARKALERERIWSTSLPFALPDHEALLTAERVATPFTLFVHFQRTRPDTDFLRDVLSSDGGTWTVHYFGPLEARAVRGEVPGAPLAWLHATVTTRLLPLHRKHLIDSVSIEVER